ncbi:MAG: hypothetical protein KKF33_00825 [Alphaproteobacteria bacterium]|nr:hypothetical protein [Alphaproteobacteria bacterium]
MSDAGLDVTTAAAEAPAARAPLYRPATYADIGMVHARLGECINGMPYYSDEFKAFEIARLSKAHLAALIDEDPHHIMIFLLKGETCGFMVSGPELGTLWLYWSYLFPDKRRSPMAMHGMPAFIEHWNNGRFHKIATYTMAGNDRAKLIMERFGYSLTATLEQHIFGEDYLLYEHKLNKVEPGYDHGIKGGPARKLLRKLRLAFAK